MRTNKGQIDLEYSYQGDHLPDTGFMDSPIQSVNLSLKPVKTAVGRTVTLMRKANESTQAST